MFGLWEVSLRDHAAVGPIDYEWLDLLIPFVFDVSVACALLGFSFRGCSSSPLLI